MRRLGTLCLLLGLAAPAFAADEPPAAEEPSIPWYRWLFLGERSKPNPPKPDQVPAAAPTARDKPPAPTSKDALAKVLAEEQRVYLKRLDAITQIRKVATEQNDEATVQRAEELEQQLFETYQQRTARLTAAAAIADDRAALERGRDDRPATAQKPAPRRRTTGGTDR